MKRRILQAIAAAMGCVILATSIEDAGRFIRNILIYIMSSWKQTSYFIDMDILSENLGMFLKSLDPYIDVVYLIIPVVVLIAVINIIRNVKPWKNDICMVILALLIMMSRAYLCMIRATYILPFYNPIRIWYIAIIVCYASYRLSAGELRWLTRLCSNVALLNTQFRKAMKWIRENRLGT